MSSKLTFRSGGGSESTATLQSTYIASSPSEIITNDSLRPFSIAGGTGSNTDINFSIKNNAGSDTLSIDADGEITGKNIKKSNIDATTSPSNTNDASEGFDISSVWVNKSTNDIYVCCDPTVNLAVWRKIDNTGLTGISSYTGATVPNQINFQNGLVQSISTRNLTPNNIGALSLGGGNLTGPLALGNAYIGSQMLFNFGRSAFGGQGYSNVLHTYRSGNVPGILDDDAGDYFIFCTTKAGSSRFSLSTTGAIFNNSDERLKENISKLDGTLDKLNLFNGVNYSWKEDESKKVHFGVIAQELITAFPELVMQETDQEKIDDPDYAGDGYMSVDYTGLHAVAIQAIKELHAKVKVLEDEIKLSKKSK